MCLICDRIDMIKKERWRRILSGIKCGYKNTSCPDQIAEALKGYMGSFEVI